jgi:hypothetical protein
LTTAQGGVRLILAAVHVTITAAAVDAGSLGRRRIGPYGGWTVIATGRAGYAPSLQEPVRNGTLVGCERYQ